MKTPIVTLYLLTNKISCSFENFAHIILSNKNLCNFANFAQTVGFSVEISLCNQYKFRNYLQKLKG